MNGREKGSSLDYAENAKFRCHKCGHEWTERAGWHVLCPKCGSLYCTWLNHPYTLYRKKHPDKYPWE